ncbi:MAG: VOC family protein [Bacteroidota bacterium]
MWAETNRRKIDHIVYCVPNLEEGMSYIEDLFGVAPIIGGKHLSKGTMNALLNLGDACYLEILAVDKDNKDFEGIRWMGIDSIHTPQIMRWALKSGNIDADHGTLSKYSAAHGIIEGGSRQTTDGRLLNWQMTLPTTAAEVDVLPFITDWSKSASHPTVTLDEHCYLRAIELFHPSPSQVQSILRDLDVNLNIRQGDKEQIVIHVDTPKGLKILF